jgi:hypothetical protein
MERLCEKVQIFEKATTSLGGKKIQSSSNIHLQQTLIKILSPRETGMSDEVGGGVESHQPSSDFGSFPAFQSHNLTIQLYNHHP